MYRCVALLLALMWASGVQACPRAVPLKVSPDTIANLVTWIERHSPYSEDGLGPPTILICRSGDVIAYEGRDTTVYPAMRAAYDRANDRIFLVMPWSASDPKNLSTLLHELVHRMQFHARTWPCPQAAEPEAYRLQQAWLAEHGVDADFDWLRIYVNADCPGDHHP